MNLGHYNEWKLKESGLEELTEYVSQAGEDIVLFKDDKHVYKAVRHNWRHYEITMKITHKLYAQLYGRGETKP